MENTITVININIYIKLKMRETWSVKNTSECYLQTKLSILYYYVLPILNQVL